MTPCAAHLILRVSSSLDCPLIRVCSKAELLAIATTQKCPGIGKCFCPRKVQIWPSGGGLFFLRFWLSW